MILRTQFLGMANIVLFAATLYAVEPCDSVLFDSDIRRVNMSGKYLCIELTNGEVFLIDDHAEEVANLCVQAEISHECEVLPHAGLLAVYRNQYTDRRSVTGAFKSLFSDPPVFELWDIATGHKKFTYDDFDDNADDCDYSLELDLLVLKLWGTVARFGNARVIRTKSREVVLDKEIGVWSCGTLFNDSSLFFFGGKTIEEYRLDADGNLKRKGANLYDFSFWPRTLMHFYHEDSTKRAVIYNESLDSTLGPVTFVAIGTMAESVIDSMVFHWSGGRRRFYGHATSELYLVQSRKILHVIDFHHRQFRDYRVEDFVGEGLLGLVIPLGDSLCAAVPGTSDGHLNKVLFFPKPK